MSAIRFIDEISETSLYRGVEERQFTFASDALLLDIHLLRSAVFAPGRMRAGRRQELRCPQAPRQYTMLSFNAPHGPLTVRDALLLGSLQRRCWGCGYGVEPTVGMSLNEAAAAMGFAGRGGAQRQMAAAALRRLAATTFAWQEAVEAEIVELRWHPIEELEIEPADQPGETVWLQLSEIAVALLEEGYLQYLNRRICEALVASDQLAARLWMALEAERLSAKPFYYRLFRCPRGSRRERSDALIVGELIGLHDWSDRRAAARRLRRACEVIGRIDPGRYALTLEHGKDTGMYNLVVRRFARPRAEAACA